MWTASMNFVHIHSESISSGEEHAKTQFEERERLLEEGREKLAAAAVELGKERNALAVSGRTR